MQADGEKVTPEIDDAGAGAVALDVGVRSDMHPRLKQPVVHATGESCIGHVLGSGGNRDHGTSDLEGDSERDIDRARFRAMRAVGFC